jgi:cysteinyl-tRNA synthetase
MTLTLYNTLTRRKDPFQPIDPKNVRMYVCGPTVYDLAHIGNARPIIVFDVLFRLLRHLAAKGEWDGGKGETKVTYARNITDVDDKINARAVELYPDLPPTEAIRKITEETTAQFHKDIAALGVLEPTVEPRATEHIAEMRVLCDALVAKGHAYVADGHVLFAVDSMPDYGKLARRSLEEMEAGARVDVAPYKRGPMDFVLWKPSKPGEPAWPAPCGIAAPGRPGWHIECSAMADRWLWQEPQVRGLLSEAGLKQPHVFDIHGGGIDLVFPHHENEIAQSRCAHGTPTMANVWMHNGFLQVEGEKMSKSLGNFVTIKELLELWPGATIRLAMLTTHYTEPLDWTRRLVEQADLELGAWAGDDQFAAEAATIEIERRQGTFQEKLPDEFIAALLDDLNTPQAITTMRRFGSKARRTASEDRQLYLMAEFLGLVRPDRLGVHTRPAYSGALMRHDIDATLRVRAAEANGLAEEKRRLLGALASAGVKVTIAPDGWVSADATDTQLTIKAQSLVDARLAARKAKKWAESDRIRDELAAMGIQLKDGKDPQTGEPITKWEVKR